MSALRILRLFVDAPFTHTGAHLRGSLNADFPDRPELHGHWPDGRARPAEVRFVVRDQIPHVVAAGPGREALVDLYAGATEIRAGERTYRVLGRELLERPVEIAPSEGIELYRTASPWLPLNQQNHEAFEAADERGRRALLERIVVGNMLTAARAVGVDVETRIVARVSRWRAREIRVGSARLLGLDAELATNLVWDPWVGIGKSVSKGFGLLDREHADG